MAVQQAIRFGEDRRKQSREKDTYYKVVITLNSLVWLALVVCLLLFHFARPEMVSGVQQFWGIDGRTSWSPEYMNALIRLLQVCLGASLITMFLRSRRSRRKEDNYGVNLFILAGISTVSLVTINSILLA